MNKTEREFKTVFVGVHARKISNQGGIFPLLVFVTTLNITVPRAGKLKNTITLAASLIKNKSGLKFVTCMSGGITPP